MINSKIKPLTKEQIIISTDRLTRFKHPETKYLRVFKDILINNLISPKFKKTDLDKMDYSELKDRAQEIINYSLKLLTPIQPEYTINKKLYEHEKSVFNIDKNTEKLLNNKINFSACTALLDGANLPKNLEWLKLLNSTDDIKKIRFDRALHFPIEKVVIAEGATEETLLPKFANLCGYDFDKNGIHLIAAGGKNQVVKLFYELAQTLKLPIYVLLDCDGVENAREIHPRMRKTDKIHIINCGEFEDLLPEDLVKRTINYELQNISIVEEQFLTEAKSRVKFLEEIFKTRGMHEFKKVEFARMVMSNINSERDISPEIREIIDEIKNL